MPFTLLEVAEIQRGELMATKSTRQQEGKQGPITSSFQQLAIWCLPECMCLLGGQPVAEPDAKILQALEAPNSRSQIGAQKAAV
jgi:hypothetical protein